MNPSETPASLYDTENPAFNGLKALGRSVPYEQSLHALKQAGFELVHVCSAIPTRKYDSKEQPRTFSLYYHPDGMIARLNSYSGMKKSANNLTFYYAIDNGVLLSQQSLPEGVSGSSPLLSEMHTGMHTYRGYHTDIVNSADSFSTILKSVAQSRRLLHPSTWTHMSFYIEDEFFSPFSIGGSAADVDQTKKHYQRPLFESLLQFKSTLPELFQLLISSNKLTGLTDKRNYYNSPNFRSVEALFLSHHQAQPLSFLDDCFVALHKGQALPYNFSNPDLNTKLSTWYKNHQENFAKSMEPPVSTSESESVLDTQEVRSYSHEAQRLQSTKKYEALIDSSISTTPLSPAQSSGLYNIIKEHRMFFNTPGVFVMPHVPDPALREGAPESDFSELVSLSVHSPFSPSFTALGKHTFFEQHQRLFVEGPLLKETPRSVMHLGSYTLPPITTTGTVPQEVLRAVGSTRKKVALLDSFSTQLTREVETYLCGAPVALYSHFKDSKQLFLDRIGKPVYVGDKDEILQAHQLSLMSQSTEAFLAMIQAAKNELLALRDTQKSTKKTTSPYSYLAMHMCCIARDKERQNSYAYDTKPVKREPLVGVDLAVDTNRLFSLEQSVRSEYEHALTNSQTISLSTQFMWDITKEAQLWQQIEPVVNNISPKSGFHTGTLYFTEDLRLTLSEAFEILAYRPKELCAFFPVLMAECNGASVLLGHQELELNDSRQILKGALATPLHWLITELYRPYSHDALAHKEFYFEALEEALAHPDAAKWLSQKNSLEQTPLDLAVSLFPYGRQETFDKELMGGIAKSFKVNQKALSMCIEHTLRHLDPSHLTALQSKNTEPTCETLSQGSQRGENVSFQTTYKDFFIHSLSSAEPYGEKVNPLLLIQMVQIFESKGIEVFSPDSLALANVNEVLSGSTGRAGRPFTLMQIAEFLTYTKTSDDSNTQLFISWAEAKLLSASLAPPKSGSVLDVNGLNGCSPLKNRI